MEPAKVKEFIAVAENEKNNYFNFRHRKASGVEAEVEVYSCPVNINGRRFLFSIIHDISARIKAEKQRVESEGKFRTLVEGAPDAIYMEVDGIFTYLNRPALKLLGAKKESDLVGTKLIDRIPEEFHGLVEDRLRRVNVENLPVEPHEHPYERLDGNQAWLDVAAVPIEVDGKPGAIVFARDIGVRKKLQQQTIEFEKQSRQHQKLEAIGTLAGGVAHEINNPLNGILNYAEIILEQSGENIETKKFAREIISETERISRIVKNLLEFSRQGKESHSYANIEDIIEKTVSLVQTIFMKEQIEIKLDIEPDLPKIKCRSEQIQQVVMNLLTNARHALNMKYHEYDKRKVIEVACEDFEDGDRRWVRITVLDRGIGISEENMDKIFEPFFSTKDRDEGTGLGLSVSYGIVREHHGIIKVESEEDEYTRFTVELPVDNGWDIEKKKRIQ
jgi:PAS domain S-box-containing protein